MPPAFPMLSTRSQWHLIKKQMVDQGHRGRVMTRFFSNLLLGVAAAAAEAADPGLGQFRKSETQCPQ